MSQKLLWSFVFCLVLPGGAGAAFTPTAFAKKKAHKAHDHGKAVLNIVTSGTQATLQFEVPSQSIYGFEHVAKTSTDIAKRDAAIAHLQTKFSEMVVFEAKLGCNMTPVKIEPFVTEESHSTSKGKAQEKHASGEHGEVRAEFTATCKGQLAGSQLTFAFTKIFPAIQRIKIQVIGELKQSGAEISKDKGSVEL